MIIIAGNIEFATGEDRDAAIAKALPFQEATRAEEPGCVEYSFAPDSGCATRVQVFELWADEASLAAHFEHPNFTAMGDVLRSTGRTGGSMAKYRADLTEPVKDPEGRYRADFFTASS
jgi:quinol monooxygenase YgiN